MRGLLPGAQPPALRPWRRPRGGLARRRGPRAEAARRGEGADAWFEAFCRLWAARAGKPRWGEKTPRHVYRIPDILARYPEARVIAMIRDPRAIAASYRDWKNQGGFDLDRDTGHREALALEEARARSSYHVVIQSLLWRGVANAALGARDRFGPTRVWVQRYEDFVEDPAAAGRALMAWLGLGFDAGAPGGADAQQLVLELYPRGRRLQGPARPLAREALRPPRSPPSRTAAAA